MMDKCVRNILTEWKDEAKISHLMLYKLRGGVLTIYTDRPGPLIGYQGNTVSKYKEKLLSLPHGWVKSLVIEETTGIF
jgi:ribosomal protein S3